MENIKSIKTNIKSLTNRLNAAEKRYVKLNNSLENIPIKKLVATEKLIASLNAKLEVAYYNLSTLK